MAIVLHLPNQDLLISWRPLTVRLHMSSQIKLQALLIEPTFVSSFHKLIIQQ